MREIVEIYGNYEVWIDKPVEGAALYIYKVRDSRRERFPTLEWFKTLEEAIKFAKSLA